MSTDYNYDEQGQFFPFFVLTISGLVTLPLTYSLLKPNKGLENTAPRISSDFKSKNADVVEGQKRKHRRQERKVKRFFTVLLGYAVMGWMIYLIIVTARVTPKIWDPYDILQISRSASEKDIKNHYKRLSLKYHPDKIRPDPALNETVESVSERFVEISKAYKALTDEEVRNNYIQYGHPDGKQSFSIGIALPKFIVTEGNGKYVLLVYGSLLGVLLPYLVGTWWYGTQRMTREKVLVASAGNLFREYEENLSEGGVIGALSSGEEFRSLLGGEKGERGSGKIERKILAGSDSEKLFTILAPADRQKLEDLDDGLRRKVLSLLWAYLGRVELEDPTLNYEKYEVAPVALSLNESFAAIALAFGNTMPILSAYRTSQNIIQAIPPGSSPLLQLPHFTPEIAQAVEGESAKLHLTVQQFMHIHEQKRRELATGPRLLSNSQYESAVSVAKQLPSLQVEKAFFKVMGERFITPGSLVQFVVKARVVPPGSSNVPEVNEIDLEDVDPDEGDLDALLGRKPAKRSKAPAEGDSKGSASDNEKLVQPPLAFGPYLARDHSPRWHLFLADGKQGKLAVPPFTFTTFERPLFNNQGEPTYAIQTFKMQFQAPPQPGQYTFVMHLVCDSYVGMDSKREVTLVVDDMARAEQIDAEDEISEPDEDSLAGQMNALKTGGLAGPTPTRPRRTRDASSEEESGTEDEDEDEATDTDTDTDTDED
ncbi:molecular chaperone [Xylona heveae TC161]|uniref:Molecular chaperone n=1 Tax=Xylona heveae (strain CBS 132557 / TC161) TaxID=1328760 RepID=A0A165HZ57_XYLHT|nr:molecular chaperone [Xylona heveae TC161]KZF24123.1 molecular chaperone [Xylona heveae TC161]